MICIEKVLKIINMLFFYALSIYFVREKYCENVCQQGTKYGGNVMREELKSTVLNS